MSRLASCISSDKAFVLYRIPGKNVCLIDQLQPRLPELQSFLMIPFSEGEEPEFRIENGSLSVLDYEEVSRSQLFPSREAGSGSSDNKQDTQREIEIDKKEHIKLINKALEELHSNTLHKVVLARKERRPLPVGFDAISFFLRLCVKYPSAFVYMIRLPGFTIWMGASPELLLRSNGLNCSTVSLAGTKPNSENRPWKDKELREQAIVSEYIRTTLEHAGISSISEEGPFDAKAGNLLHLKTVFRFRTNISAEKLARKLHPTPAIAGIPKQAATDFILQNEKTTRSYYTGFTGPYDSEKSEFYVNLRCASLFHKQIDLYAGGGILEGSEAEAEYQETLHKMQTVWSVVENS
jgi:isochorismate synthase